MISISLGGAFLFVEDAPYPYDADLESLFISTIIPYFQDLLNKHRHVYLIGHSMGGFNALMLALRNPSKFTCIATISPFVAPISPFSKEFEIRGKELRMSKFQIFMIKNMLTTAFETQEKWTKYNPFNLINNFDDNEYPFIILSSATNDLPGFAVSINGFSKLLDKKDFPYYYCEAEGDHKSICHNVFYKFLEKINRRR